MSKRRWSDSGLFTPSLFSSLFQFAVNVRMIVHLKWRSATEPSHKKQTPSSWTVASLRAGRRGQVEAVQVLVLSDFKWILIWLDSVIWFYFMIHFKRSWICQHTHLTDRKVCIHYWSDARRWLTMNNTIIESQGVSPVSLALSQLAAPGATSKTENR